ncbi:MAG: hypothetical protein QOD11_89 [Bradyrhizobium sp.]|jgi:hypothetical protein|nr:hypothetical protein [Bradyrhizobium sp.]
MTCKLKTKKQINTCVLQAVRTALQRPDLTLKSSLSDPPPGAGLSDKGKLLLFFPVRGGIEFNGCHATAFTPQQCGAADIIQDISDDVAEALGVKT